MCIWDIDASPRSPSGDAANAETGSFPVWISGAARKDVLGGVGRNDDNNWEKGWRVEEPRGRGAEEEDAEEVGQRRRLRRQRQ